VRIRQISEGHRGRTKMPEHASCESFIKTLKREEIYREQVRRPGRSTANIEDFIEQYYKRKRLHSTLAGRQKF